MTVPGVVPPVDYVINRKTGSTKYLILVNGFTWQKAAYPDGFGFFVQNHYSST